MSETHGPAGTFILAQSSPTPEAPAPGTGTHSGVEIGVPPAEAHGSGFPPFDATTFPSQLIWLAITFVALYLLMSRIALPRIATILEERHDRIADDLEEAGKLKSESETAAKAYEQALTGARGKATAIASETREKLSGEAETGRKALEAELAAKLADAEAKIAATKTSAMANVRGIAVDAAGAIVNQLTGAEPAPQAVEAAVDKAIGS
ncbi:F0F1 ATP synthase subunit B [Ancylobacter sonchi]|uniref:F0F1 ATP synthase subunit B n=1 Tax=Ancylobacter sonchi TaxID=1937790 RepID=UPI001BD5F905|nr:F0F1 ATP synthase subunit B [Ancylobacter sonchi]MBS7536820.1 F0F1 ATP synthase subunit B [Ancylobacter sonchi]